RPARETPCAPLQPFLPRPLLMMIGAHTGGWPSSCPREPSYSLISLAPPGSCITRRSRSLQAHLLIGRRKVQHWVQTNRQVLDPRTHSMQSGRLVNRGVHDPPTHQPLALVDQRLAFP